MSIDAATAVVLRPPDCGVVATVLHSCLFERTTMIVRPALTLALAFLVISLPTSAQVTFSVDDSSSTLSDPAPIGRPITSGDILTPQGGIPRLPSGGQFLQTPDILIGIGSTPGLQGFLNVGNADLCVGVEPGNRCEAELDALTYGRDDLVFDFSSFLGVTSNVHKARWHFSVDQFALGNSLGVDPTTESENRLVPGIPALAGDTCADVFGNLRFAAAPPLGPAAIAAGNIGISDGNGFPSRSSFLVYPGLGLKEPNIPFPSLPAPPGAFPGDNLDALDCDGPIFPAVSFPVFFSLDSSFFDPKGMTFNTGTAGSAGFVGGDILVTPMSGAPTLVYAAATLLGLDGDGADTDDIDALILTENGVAGFQPSLVPYDWTMGTTDQLFFSVRRGSAIINNPMVLDSIFGVEIEPGDILVPPVAGGNGNPGIFIAAEVLGLKTKRAFDPCGDDLDALDYKVQDTLIAHSYCFGDGGVDVGGGVFCKPCPCSNDVPVGTQTGCLNSAGTGAELIPSGLASLTADTLRFEVMGAKPNSFAIMVHGSKRLPGMGVCMGAGVSQPMQLDGLRCVGMTTRIGGRAVDAMGNIGITNNGWGPPNGPAVGILQRAALIACQERQFMVIYREDPTVHCGNGLNTSNGVQITVIP